MQDKLNQSMPIYVESRKGLGFFIKALLVIMLSAGAGYWYGVQNPSLLKMIKKIPVESPKVTKVTVVPLKQKKAPEKENPIGGAGGYGDSKDWPNIHFGKINLKIPFQFYLSNPRSHEQLPGYTYVYLNYLSEEILPKSQDLKGKYKMDMRTDPGSCIFSQVKERIQGNVASFSGQFNGTITDVTLPQGYQAVYVAQKGSGDTGGESNSYFIKYPDSHECVEFYFYLDFENNKLLIQDILSTLQFNPVN